MSQAAKVDLAFRETLEKPIEMEMLRLTKDVPRVESLGLRVQGVGALESLGLGLRFGV